MIIKNACIHDAVNREAYEGDILVQGGKISRIGYNLSCEGEEVIDVKGLNVFPGFVECHGHIGLDGWGIGYEGQDYNEYGDINSPQLRAIDALNPRDYALTEAREAGVTTLNIGPGSANVLGGTFAAFKPYGLRIDNMIIKQPTAMKCAFGENPKRCYKDKANSSRMTTAARLREMLFKAKEYACKKELNKDNPEKQPAFDMKLEALIPVIKGELPLKAHAHQANDIFTAIRIAKEFNLKLTLEHVTEGHLIADELAKENYMLAVGPTLGHATKFELKDKSWTTPGVLSNAGCHVSIITDSPVIPQKYLPICAGLAVKAGMDPFDALKAVTINPARHTGVSDRVGSLEVGKDADIFVCDGDPFEINCVSKYVFINGVNVLN